MTTVDLLRKQLEYAHDTQESTMADVAKETSDFNETNKALPVGAAYAHSVLGEDMVVSQMLAHKEPLYKEGEDVGLSEPMPRMDDSEKHALWVKNVKVDLDKFKEFAKKVYQATDDYLASLTEEDIEKEVDNSWVGKKTLQFLISNFVILHIANLTGEISSVKGIQGLKGYPF